MSSTTTVNTNTNEPSRSFFKSIVRDSMVNALSRIWIEIGKVCVDKIREGLSALIDSRSLQDAAIF